MEQQNAGNQTGGDRIEGNVEGADTTAIGSNIKQDKTIGGVANVTLNLSPEKWVDVIRQGGLSMTEAAILQTQITGLQNTSIQLSSTVASLESAVDSLNKIVENEIKASKERGERSDARLADLSSTVKELTGALKGEVSKTESISSSLSIFARKMEEQEKNERPIFDRRTSNLILIAVFLIIVLLGLIAYSNLSRNILSAQTSAAFLGAIAAWFIAFRSVWV